MLMGATVEEFIAKELNVSRRDQDAYALLSQQRAEAAWKEGAFLSETFVIPGVGKSPDFQDDEHRRSGSTLDALAKLSPVFDSKGGSVTAGNSSGITDGSAFVEVTAARSSTSQVELLDSETVALDPRRMGLGPIEATSRLLKRQGLTVEDLDFIEMNEAFAAQVLACLRALKVSEDRVNLRGGAIALGHPIGATGTRILVTLIHQMLGKPGSLGLATLCVSGGMGVSVLVRSL
jgi:acetyl-CoA C-acetyltransferase